jgi:hypothetical protein
MFLESIEGKWKSVSVNAQCDECGAKYRAKISTALKQEVLVGYHQCKRCSSRRAGKKTAAKMSEIYSRWYSGDGNFSKKQGVGEKISQAKKGVMLTDAHKKALHKPKSKIDKIKAAANSPKEIARRKKLMLEHNPTDKQEVREKISNTISRMYADGKYDNFYNKMKTGWVSTNKTLVPIWCRSGLEKEFLKKASECAKIKSIESAEKIRLSYEFNGSNHKYLPDFKIIMEDGRSMIVEIKSSYFETMPNWEPKKKALHEFCRIINIEYVVLSEKEMDKWLEPLKE